MAKLLYLVDEWSFTGGDLPFEGRVHESVAGVPVKIRFTSDQEISKEGWKISYKSQGNSILYIPSYCTCTLFSKRSAHENHPNFLWSLGQRPQPRVSDPGSQGELG